MTRSVKVYISVDAEGMPYAASLDMWKAGAPYYERTVHNMTDITALTIAQLAWAFLGNEYPSNYYSHLRGITSWDIGDTGRLRVTVADSHGSMMNIDPDRLYEKALHYYARERCPPRSQNREYCLYEAEDVFYSNVFISIIRGTPRPLSMVTGAEGHDFAVFLGYHATPQMGGLLGHVIGGSTIQRIRVYNESDASEYLLNTYALGEKGVPLLLVAGDSRLKSHVEKHTPWAKFVVLVEGLTGLASRTPPIQFIAGQLYKAIEDIVGKLDLLEFRAKPLVPEEKWIEVEFKRPWYADAAEMIPCTKRLDGLRVRFECNTFEDTYKAVEAAVILGYSLKK